MTTKERPILFSGPMVRAILDGRKTMTRRAVKKTASGLVKEPNGHRRWHPADPDAVAACPYGSPGDRLWVRETWRVASSGRNYQSQTTTVYAEHRERSTIKPRSGGAQHQSAFVCSDSDSDALLLGAYGGGKAGAWRPSTHMPRWASRIALEVTDVRIERLQDITEEDARAEGVEPIAFDWRNYMPEREAPKLFHKTARGSFFSLWESLNGTASLAANPWVWVVSFRRLQP